MTYPAIAATVQVVTKDFRLQEVAHLLGTSKPQRLGIARKLFKKAFEATPQR